MFLTSVFIGNQDITDLVQEISGIRTFIDISVPFSFQKPRLSVTIRYDSDWDPTKATNWFTTNSYNGNGYLAPCSVKMTSSSGSEVTVFAGKIESINPQVKPNLLVISVADQSVELRRNKIENFGVQKYVLLERGDAGINGEYPFSRALSPVSDESFSANSFNVVDALETSGTLNNHNIKVGENKAETEGGFPGSDPQAELKVPYRWKKVSDLVKDILALHGISDGGVDKPDPRIFTNYVLSSWGRPGYYHENSKTSDKNKAFRWTGYVRDQLEHGNNIYSLYSVRGGYPKILKRVVSTDVHTTVTESGSRAEWVKMATSDGVKFFVLGTTAVNNPEIPVLGAYDPTETNSATQIWTAQGNTVSVLVPNTTSLKPVVGMYYHFGFAQNETNRKGIRPDSRKGFMVIGNFLYYIYATSTAFGIAKVSVSGGTPTALNTLPRIGRWSHLSLDFAYKTSDSKIYCACVFQKGDRSKLYYFWLNP